jgi:hypothetical protein
VDISLKDPRDRNIIYAELRDRIMLVEETCGVKKSSAPTQHN